MGAADRPPRRDRKPEGAVEAVEVLAALSQLFGFAQFELAGTLSLPDGRYLAREEGEGGAQRVLVVETTGAPPAPGRRRRRPKQAAPGAEPEALPLTRVTAVRAHEPFEDEGEAGAWLSGAIGDEEAVDAIVGEGIALLNRALHAQSVAGADPLGFELGAERAATVRVGYGSGEEVAAGRFTEAHEVDMRGGVSRRRRREEELRPQERVAAILGGRERIDACEALLLRARADLDAGRRREAALQLRVGLEALLAELPGALTDPGHEKDMAQLNERRQEAGDAANDAIGGELDLDREKQVEELLALCERVLRRRRVLKG